MDDLQTPWLSTIRKFDRTNTIVILLGLKCEKEERTISKEEATLFAKTQAMDTYLEASTHNRVNLDEIFHTIAEMLIERHGLFLDLIIIVLFMLMNFCVVRDEVMMAPPPSVNHDELLPSSPRSDTD